MDEKVTIGKFEFMPPYKLSTISRITLDIINEPMAVFKFITESQVNYFEKSYAVFTKKGIVIVYEAAWDTNQGKKVFSYFRTMINGLCYSAFREDSKYTDKEATNLATRFINIITNNLSTPKQ